MAKPTGRPCGFNQEMADLICERVSTHSCGLQRLCNMFDDMPVKSTINLWRSQFPAFSAQYALAKLKQADLLAEEIIEIADDSRGDITINEQGEEVINSEFVARSRLRIDTRKWLASKLLPKQYGDKTQTEVTVRNHEDELKALE